MPVKVFASPYMQLYPGPVRLHFVDGMRTGLDGMDRYRVRDKEQQAGE